MGSALMKYPLHFIGQAFHPSTIVPTYRAGRAGAEIAPRLNIKYGFNPDGIKRKTNSIG
jgi:hypothetical protein